MPRADITVAVGIEWSPTVTEFAGGLWMLRGLGAADTAVYNTTTARYLSLGSPLVLTGVGTVAGATYRASKPHQIHTLAALFESAFPGGATATFKLNVNGVTQGGLVLTASAGDTKKVATGLVVIAQDDFVCLECTDDVGGTPDIRSMSLAYSVIAGANPDV